MAELLSISLPTYRRIKTGLRKPKLEELKIICETYDIDLDFFTKEPSSIFQKNDNNSDGYINSHIVSMDKDVSTAFIKAMEDFSTLLNKQGK
jgi:transcriptional regulator with XRE-family HTH domain